MIDLLAFDLLEPILAQLALFLTWLLFGLVAYAALADRAVFEDVGRVPFRCFGKLDVFICSVLGLLLLLLIANGAQQAAGAHTSGDRLPNGREMAVEVVLSAFVLGMIMACILASLAAREVDWREAFGVQQVPWETALGQAILLLALALPLIYTSLAVWQLLLVAAGGRPTEPQQIVNFLQHEASGAAKGFVIFSGVILAPLQEEFIFRGYIYPVVRRYAGAAAGLLVNGLLFAAIHLHVPSFAGLFVLAACLTLAYEWTGSLLVPITMHALFNCTSIVSLFAGGTNS